MPHPVERYHLTEIRGWMTGEELAWLYDMAHSTMGRILEVGTYCGRSLCALLAGQRDAGRSDGVIGVDTFDGQGTVAEAVVRLNPPETHMAAVRAEVAARSLPQPILMAMPSAIAALQFLPGELALVFIDGDHGYGAVRADIARWQPTLRPGGVLCGHDYDPDWPSVQRAVRDALGEPENPVGSLWMVRA